MTPATGAKAGKERQFRHTPDEEWVILIERTKGARQHRFDESRVAVTREEIAELARKYPVIPARLEDPPKCTDCGCEMGRYGNSLDTGKDGWACPECGWSEDDAE